MPHQGRICIRCPECGCRQWVLVTFPEWNKPFTTTTHTCQRCGVTLEVSDPHEFDENGYIIN